MENNSFYKIFSKAGFQKINLKSRPNRYRTSLPSALWYSVETEFGKFIIGWDKKIIQINWGDLVSDEAGVRNEVDIAHLFDSEDVIKNTVMIRAQGWIKAQEYLTRIYDHLKT